MDNNPHEQLDLFKEGFWDVKPIDIQNDLPRHPNKVYSVRSCSNIKRIVIHTTDWIVTPQRLAEYDISPNHISATGCPAITYHELVMNDGKIFKTLPWTETSWHVGLWNPGSLALALVFKATDKEDKDQYAPSKNSLLSLQTRCGDICLQLALTPDKVKGHRELKGTGWFWQKGSKRLRKTCPGLKVDMDLLRTNIAIYMQCRLKLEGLYSGEIDGQFGKKSRAALKEY